MATTVWAFRRLAELNHATALVECDEELATRLIAEGLVQDPLKVSALELKEIEPLPAVGASAASQEYKTTRLMPADYHTTDLKPPANSGKKRSR